MSIPSSQWRFELIPCDPALFLPLLALVTLFYSLSVIFHLSSFVHVSLSGTLSSLTPSRGLVLPDRPFLPLSTLLEPPDAPWSINTTAVESAITCPHGIDKKPGGIVLLVHGTGSLGWESWQTGPYVVVLPKAGKGYDVCWVRSEGEVRDRGKGVRTLTGDWYASRSPCQEGPWGMPS